jgi:predicted PurR-regulated permease PerM
LPGERQLPNGHEGAPIPESKAGLPPIIRRTEVVAVALAGLLVIAVIAGLYLFLPVTVAFIVGTMLSPVANLLERCRVPRAVAAVLIVGAVTAAAAFMVSLIASPVMSGATNSPSWARD